MARDFVVTLLDEGERAEAWRRIYGSDSVCVRSPTPERFRLPGYPEGALCYELDVELLTPEQRTRLVADLAERFGMSEAKAAETLKAQGLPLLAEGLSLTVHNPQRWLT